MDALDRIRSGEWGTRDVLDAVEEAMDWSVPWAELDAAIEELRNRTVRPEYEPAGEYQPMVAVGQEDGDGYAATTESEAANGLAGD